MTSRQKADAGKNTHTDTGFCQLTTCASMSSEWSAENIKSSEDESLHLDKELKSYGNQHWQRYFVNGQCNCFQQEQKSGLCLLVEIVVNSLTPIRVCAGMKTSRPVSFMRQEQDSNSTEHQHNSPHKSPWCSICPPYGIDSRNHPNLTHGWPSNGVG